MAAGSSPPPSSVSTRRTWALGRSSGRPSSAPRAAISFLPLASPSRCSSNASAYWKPEQPPPLAPDMLLAAMKTLGLSSSAYAYAVDASGETTLPLIEGDPFPKGSEPALLDDAGWLSLQSICG